MTGTAISDFEFIFPIHFRLHLVLKYSDCDIFCSGRGVEEEMKVTVSFNTVKIVVPCGDGEKTVRELTQLATIRY